MTPYLVYAVFFGALFGLTAVGALEGILSKKQTIALLLAGILNAFAVYIILFDHEHKTSETLSYVEKCTRIEYEAQPGDHEGIAEHAEGPERSH